MNCIKKAADAEAALAWLTSKKPPDPESPAGLNPERRHLREIGEDGKDRWLVWTDEEFDYDNDNEASEAKKTRPVWKEWRYDNDEDDVPDFTEDTEIGMEAEGWNPETEDQLAFRSADAMFLSMPDRSKEQEYEMEVPAGSYYCVTGTTTCTAPGFLDTRLRYAAWRSLYSSRASSGVRYASFSRRQHWL